MKKNKAHIAVYGSAKLIRKRCPECKEMAFVIDNTFSYCHGDDSGDADKFKIMSEASGRRKGPSIKIQKELIRRQRNKCFYCDKEIGTYYVRNNVVRKTTVHYDHFLPFSYLQDNPYDNWVMACNICNLIKSSKVFENMDLAKQFIYTRRMAKEIEYL